MNVFLRLIFGFLILSNLSSCFFRVGSVKNINADYIIEKEKQEEYIIVHVNGSVWHLNSIEKQGNSIIGTKSDVSRMHQEYLKTEFNDKKVYGYKNGKSSPVNEMHIYADTYESESIGKIKINIEDISKIEVYDKAGGVSAAVLTGAVAGSAAIFLLIACSCPDLYVYNGDSVYYQGGIFPGAIYKTLERDDYIVLDGIGASNGKYLLRLSNQKPEAEYINYTALKVVNHPAGAEPLYSKYGELLLISNPKAPNKAVDSNQKSISNMLLTRDNELYEFNSTVSKYGYSELEMTFNLPKGKSEATLILNAKNTNWMDNSFKTFFSMFGNKFEDFNNGLKNRPAENRIKWLKEQGVVLNVYLDIGNGWEYYDYFNVVGSGAFRDVAMKIRLDGAQGESFKIKLESGFNFWEVDYAGIDFEGNDDFIITEIPPAAVYNRMGEVFTKEVAAKDDLYLSSIDPGEEIFLEFNTPTLATEKASTVILHTAGYYEIDYTFEGEPNLSYLRKFRKKGNFSKFSKNLYEELNKAQVYTRNQ